MSFCSTNYLMFFVRPCWVKEYHFLGNVYHMFVCSNPCISIVCRFVNEHICCLYVCACVHLYNVGFFHVYASVSVCLHLHVCECVCQSMYDYMWVCMYVNERINMNVNVLCVFEREWMRKTLSYTRMVGNY